MKVKEESEKFGLKLNIQKTKIMASGSITSWEIDGETVETVAVFIFLGSKITAVGDCSHEIKRCLLLGRKALTNLDSIFKDKGALCLQIWKTRQWPQDWKGQFSFQSQRKAMPKNAQTTTQLHSSHMLVK